jgi:hypothetical protein
MLDMQTIRGLEYSKPVFVPAKRTSSCPGCSGKMTELAEGVLYCTSCGTSKSAAGTTMKFGVVFDGYNYSSLSLEEAESLYDTIEKDPDVYFEESGAEYVSIWIDFTCYVYETYNGEVNRYVNNDSMLLSFSS